MTRPVFLSVAATALFALGIVAAGAGGAQAHSFSVALVAGEKQDRAALVSAVRGFLIASAERDSHAEETSDGHIGGLDVDIVPLLDEAMIEIDGLKGARPAEFDVLVALGAADPAAAMLPGQTQATVVLRPGQLPEDWSTGAGSTSFAGRYRDAWGAEPDRAAAQGYNAARRLERAVRPLGGVGDPATLDASLKETVEGIAW